jgi:hypothetical protein
MSELRDQILAIEDIEEELVDVPQWGVKVLVRGMDGSARAKFMQRSARSANRDGNVDLEAFYPQLIIATSFDPDTDEKLFDPADKDVLNTKSGAALQVLADVALRLSGIGANALEEAKEDLDETPNDDSI